MHLFRKLKLNYMMIDETSVVALHLIGRCTHHILTSSTFSFWSPRRAIHTPSHRHRGAYLDPKQPRGGRTLFPRHFYTNLGQEMIPYAEWELLDEA